jgi:serpin B
LTIADCLARHRRLLLRGEPGSGKTTALRHVARSYAKGTQTADEYPTLPLTPVLVRLADYAKARERHGSLSFICFVLTRSQPDSAAILERALEEELLHGKCLVLFDGLDEVGGDGSLSAVLREFVARYPDNHLVLTSRVVGLDAGPWNRLGFTTYDVTRWREEDIRRFAARWYSSWHGKGGRHQLRENERRAEELTATLLGNPHLREIATNPLMLTILAALYHANAALPRRRVDLYAKVVEVLLETWEAGKRDARPGDPLHGVVLEPRDFAWLLSRLGLAMQRQDRVLSPRWWVTEFVQAFLRDTLALAGDEAKDQGDRVIRHLCERSGLLVERGADLFGFSHRTFQEYFAARGILEDASGGAGDALSLLRPYLYHPRWEEVVRLVSAQLAPLQATALLRLVLDDPDPAGRFLKRGLRLAPRCLADGTAVADRRLLDQVFSEGGAVGGSKWLGIPLDIIEALRELRPTRHAADANRMLADIESAARSGLTPAELFALYEAIHEPLWDVIQADEAPGKVSPKDIGGHHVLLVSLAPRLLSEDSKTWHAQVFRLLRSRAARVAVKRILIDDVLRYEVDDDEQVRDVLADLLARDRIPEVRAACAWALQRAATRHPDTAERLFRALSTLQLIGENAAMNIAPLVEGNNRFALDLNERLRSCQGNVFFSPSSISMALAMAYAGASGRTEAEMAKTLHFAIPRGQLHDAMGALQSSWRTSDKKAGFRLHLANRLWGQEGYEFLPEFLAVTREKYGAELARLDFAQKSEEARQTINQWVEQQTEDKIRDLIPRADLLAGSPLVLTNAVYFKGDWAKPFEPKMTTEEDFHISPSEEVEVSPVRSGFSGLLGRRHASRTEKVKVPLMHQQDEFHYAAVDELQVLDMRYGDGSLSMVILLPQQVDGLARLEGKLNPTNLQRWMGSVRPQEVVVYLPRFKMTSRFEMSATLKSLGMVSA